MDKDYMIVTEDLDEQYVIDMIEEFYVEESLRNEILDVKAKRNINIDSQYVDYMIHDMDLDLWGKNEFME